MRYPGNRVFYAAILGYAQTFDKDYVTDCLLQQVMFLLTGSDLEVNGAPLNL